VPIVEVTNITRDIAQMRTLIHMSEVLLQFDVSLLAW
tara:strand:- start:11554 stop:11664 length:111 start_codon:yes stop_codon:yes gene_type:complete